MAKFAVINDNLVVKFLVQGTQKNVEKEFKNKTCIKLDKSIGLTASIDSVYMPDVNRFTTPRVGKKWTWDDIKREWMPPEPIPNGKEWDENVEQFVKK